MKSIRNARRTVLALLALASAAALAACGSSSSSGGTPTPSPAGSGSSGSASSTQANDQGPGLRNLPAALQAAYKQSGQTTQDSPYFSFKAKSGPPWTIAYVSTYSGNTWRSSVLDEIEKQFAAAKAAGLVSKLIVTQSNNNVSLTSQQIRQALDQGANGILTIAPSATGINPAIDAAFRQGVPVVNFTSPVTDVNAINTGVNYYEAGRAQAEYVSHQVGKGGKVVYLNGIPGFAASEQMKQGSLDVYKENGVDVAATVDGIWTNSIAKAGLLKALATMPGKIDYVAQQSGMAEGAIEALQQTGRSNVPVTIADDVAGAAYWKAHPSFVKEGFSEFPARSEAHIAFDVLLRTLEGQQPKITSILRQPSTFTFNDLSTLLPAGANSQSTDWIESVPDSYYTDTLPEFFAKPSDPLSYKAK